MKGDTMTYEHSFANSQWRSGTQPEAIVNWPPIEEEDTMTDGPSLTTPRIIINVVGVEVI